MIRRQPESSSTPTVDAVVDFHDWVLSLPWVIERPHRFGGGGVRSFAVDCEPLGRHQLWLVTGLRQGRRRRSVDVAMIVPCEAARALETTGWGRPVSPMPARRVLMRLADDATARPDHLEALALDAYNCAMSSGHER